MTCSASSVASLPLFHGVGPAFFPAWPMISADEFGHAQIMNPTPLPSATRQSALLALGFRQRELQYESERLRNLRRNKAASICEAELRAVVNEILAMGHK